MIYAHLDRSSQNHDWNSTPHDCGKSLCGLNYFLFILLSIEKGNGGEVGAKGVKWSVFGGIFLRDLKRKSKFQLSKNPPRRYTKTAPLHPFCPTLPPIYTPAGTCWNPIRTQLNEGWREGLTIYSHLDRKTWKSQNSSRHFPPKKHFSLLGR